MFVILSDGRARLDFIQNMEYKFVELLSATFVRSSDEVVRQQITYRYNAMKVRLRGGTLTLVVMVSLTRPARLHPLVPRAVATSHHAGAANGREQPSEGQEPVAAAEALQAAAWWPWVQVMLLMGCTVV